jgi:hypothetical protein
VAGSSRARQGQRALQTAPVSTPRAACPKACPSRRPAGRAERVGDGGRRGPHQQRALQRQRHALDQPARAALDSSGSPACLEAQHRVVEPRVGAAGAVELGEVRLHARGLTRHGPQDVEGVDVARALPHRVERCFAVEPRHAGVLDVAVAAQALQRLGRDGRAALADPVLADGGGDALERLLLRVAAAGPVDRAGEAQGERGGRLGLEVQVGQHVAHQRLVDQQTAERRPVARVVHGLRHRARMPDALR